MNTRLPEKSLPQMLRHHAQTQADALALRQKDFGIWQPVSWAEYYRESCCFALALKKLGVKPGAHVAIVSENRKEWVVAQMGVGILGAVTVGVYPTSPANEIAYVLEHADIELVVCEDQEQTDKVLEIWDQVPTLRLCLTVEKKGMRAYYNERVKAFEAVQAIGAQQLKAQPQLCEQWLDESRLDDIAMMIYTSGSTGKPKGAMITWRNIWAATPGLIDALHLDKNYSCLSYLPLCHVAEQLMTNFVPLYLGSVVSFGESLRTIQEDLREVAPSCFLGVPRIWEKLHASIHIKILETGALRRALYHRAMNFGASLAYLPRPAWTLMQRLQFGICYWLVFRALQNFIGLRKARIALTGAAPISPEITKFFRSIGIPLVEIYGQTEAAGQPMDQVIPGTIGVAIGGVEVKLDDRGEILIGGPQVFHGYYKNEQATRDTVRQGWLHTGDVGVWQDGQLKIVDRIKDIIITAGGKNLSPSEIENTVKASPYLKECIVIGDRRKFVSALLQIDFETTAKWAEEHGHAFTTFKNLTENPAARALVESEIKKANAKLPSVAQIKRFHLLTKELDHDDDEVTATMKVRRSNIHDKYKAEIEAMYA
ncbi:MAG: AMP-dependent synthetase/ligase [Panacagrimonas sp.]